MEGPLRLVRPTFEGEEPERERGGVCTDIMADVKNTRQIERFAQPRGASARPIPRRHGSEQGRGESRL